MKKRYPDYDVTVYERNRADDTFGFGVVFSDETLDNLMDYDAQSYHAITREFSYWDEIDFHFHGEVVRSTGHGFCGTERRTLLHGAAGALPRARRQAGILARDRRSRTVHGCRPDRRGRRHQQLHPRDATRSISSRRSSCGATISSGSAPRAPTPAFSFHFTTNEFGIWDLCTYQYKQNMSTWVIEAPDATWAKAEPMLGKISEQETVAYLEKLCGRTCSTATDWSPIARTGGAFR